MRRRTRRPVWPGHATVPDAIRYLASACDGARRRDGHGFNADHVPAGHHLAHTPDLRWTACHHRTGRELVRVSGGRQPGRWAVLRLLQPIGCGALK